MLDLESKMEILGITIYRDADKADAYYYLPNQPHISRDAGGPMFDLFAYRKGGDAGEAYAGGFLTMTVDTGLGDLHDRILGALKARSGGDATLTSVPYSKGTVRLIALDADSTTTDHPKFVQSVLGAGVPSLDGDNRAIFSLSLSEDGTSFFLGVLKGAANARPVGVIYELEYVGLLPAYSLSITIDMKSSYEYMGTRTSVNTLFFKADIETATEELKKRDSITIKETVRTLELSAPDAMAERQKTINNLVVSLCSGTLFQQTLNPGSPMVNGQLMSVANQPSGNPNATGTAATAATTATTRPTTPGAPTVATAPTVPTATPGVTTPPVTTPVTQRPAGGSPMPPPRPPEGGTGGTPPIPTPPTTPTVPTAPPTLPTLPTVPTLPSIPTLPTSAPTVPTAAPTVPTAAPTSPTAAPTHPTAAPTTPTTTTTQPPQDQGLQGVWDKLGRPQAAFALRSVSQEEQKLITYNLDQVTAQKETVNPQSMLQFMCAPGELMQRVHIIDLNNEFFQHIPIRVDASDVDFAAQGVNEMTVEIQYGVRQDGTGPKDTASAILRSNADFKEFVFFVDQTRNLQYKYRLIIDYKQDFGLGVRQTHVEGPWTPSELRTLSVHPSWLGVMVPARLQLAPNTPDDVIEVQVQARYRSPDGTVDDGEQVSLTRDNRSAVLPLRLQTAGDPVSFTSKVFYADGTSEDLAPQTLPNGQATDALAIGIPAAGRINGDIVLVDALGELAKVIVDTEVSQAGKVVDSRSVELAGAAIRQPFSVRLPDRNAKASLRWRQRLIYKDGGMETLEWADAATSNLVAGIPSEGVLTVNVRYVGPSPSQSGLAVVVVQLNYTDPGGDRSFDQQASLIIDDTAASQLQEWKARLKDKNARSYTWSLTTMTNDGAQVTTTPKPSSELTLLIRPQSVASPVPAGGGA